jgi:ribonuclease E
MASHDPSRSGPDRDPASTPIDAAAEPAEDAQASPAGGEGVVSPSRPRGAASFPGGAPPAGAPSVPTLPPQPTLLAAEPPSFQVTTVETTTAASFPGGPPPAHPRAATPTGDGQAVQTGTPGTAPAAEGRAPADEGKVAHDAAAPEVRAPTVEGKVAHDAPASEGRAPADEGGVATAVPPTEQRAPAEGGAATTALVPAVDAPAGSDAEGPAPAGAGEAQAPGRRVRSRGRTGPRAGSTGAAEAAVPAATPSAGEALGGPLAGHPTVAPDTTPAAAEPVPGAGEAEGDRPDAGVPAGRGARGRGRPRGARGPSARGAREEGQAAQVDEVPAAAVDEAVPATPPGHPAPAPGTGEPAEEAAAEPGDEDSARPGRRRRRRRSAQARAAAPQDGEPGTAEPASAVPAASLTMADDESDEESLDDLGPGSARTRARRRRRAAAKARVRAEVDVTVGEARQAEVVEPAPPEPATRPSGRIRRRGAQAPDESPSAERPARGRRGRPAAASQGEQPPVAAQPEPAARERPAAERSTRIDARARGGTRQGDRGRRRRPQGLTEEQKQVLRAGPDKRMLVTEGVDRTQIGVLEGATLVEHYVTRKSGRSYVGNIYLGRVQNVLPGMEAAFVDIGKGRNAVLYAGEVNYDEEDLDGEAPRIEKALRPGQSVLVQVTKDPIGAKGARLTAQVSLAGRYLVLQPDDSTFGISRRLPENERVRLREILKEVRPKGLGLIVRTAAEGASADDLRADLARLQARWETIERKAKKASAPAVIYSEPELVVRVIRDIFSPDFVELVVDGVELHERVGDYLTEVAPDQLAKLRLHEGRLPLFEHYRVVEQIHKALERKVWLPSGGSIVIDRTEAMTVVDVNTGKFVGKSNLEETVVANNLEAADELVRQLRLRDIGGIIIIDFIDMLFERNQQAVVERLRAALARDKTKSQVMEVSSLGLVQMTRKRVSGGLLESFSETCPHCEGRGVVITHEI